MKVVLFALIQAHGCTAIDLCTINEIGNLITIRHSLKPGPEECHQYFDDFFLQDFMRKVVCRHTMYLNNHWCHGNYIRW